MIGSVLTRRVGEWCGLEWMEVGDGEGGDRGQDEHEGVAGWVGVDCSLLMMMSQRVDSAKARKAMQ